MTPAENLIRQMRLKLEEACILDFPGESNNLALFAHPSKKSLCQEAIEGQWYGERIRVIASLYQTDEVAWRLMEIPPPKAINWKDNDKRGQ